MSFLYTYNSFRDFPYVDDVYLNFFKLLDKNNIVLEYKPYKYGIDYHTKKSKDYFGFKYTSPLHSRLWIDAMDEVAKAKNIAYAFKLCIAHRPNMVTVRFQRIVNQLVVDGTFNNYKCLSTYKEEYKKYTNAKSGNMIKKMSSHIKPKEKAENKTDENLFDLIKQNPSEFETLIGFLKHINNTKTYYFGKFEPTISEVIQLLDDTINPKYTKRVVYVYSQKNLHLVEEHIAQKKIQDKNANECIEYYSIPINVSFVSLLNVIDKQRYIKNLLTSLNIKETSIPTEIKCFGGNTLTQQFGNEAKVDFVMQLALCLNNVGNITL